MKSIDVGYFPASASALNAAKNAYLDAMIRDLASTLLSKSELANL